MACPRAADATNGKAAQRFWREIFAFNPTVHWLIFQEENCGLTLIFAVVQILVNEFLFISYFQNEA